MPLLEGLRVVHSTIHGYGLIATRAFTAGEVVCHGDGVMYGPDAEFDDTYALILPDDGAGLGDHLFLDLACQTRWINHSCEPNTDVCSDWDAERQSPRVWWVATRYIPVGEELSYDYGFAAEVAEPCACGTPSCRGLIVDDDPENLAQLPEELKHHLRVDAAAPRAAS